MKSMTTDLNIKISREIYSHLHEDGIYSMWPKVLAHVKKNPYIFNQNHIFSKNYSEVISV
jgi:hypothetical protein